MFTPACHIDERAIYEINPIKVGNDAVLLLRADDGFYATQSRRMHRVRSMASGKIIDGKFLY